RAVTGSLDQCQQPLTQVVMPAERAGGVVQEAACLDIRLLLLGRERLEKRPARFGLLVRGPLPRPSLRSFQCPRFPLPVGFAAWSDLACGRPSLVLRP